MPTTYLTLSKYWLNKQDGGDNGKVLIHSEIGGQKLHYMLLLISDNKEQGWVKSFTLESFFPLLD